MRLPRRTPYYGNVHEEISYVYERFYGDRRDRNAIESALGVVRLWIHRTCCPQAVESTALLVESVMLDQTRVSDYAARASYAMALTRLVNSVVDSFQTGVYAQSIGAIAEQIGLPQWLVQVRHCSTHEELPSISVCRTASERALAWLDHHYWRPTLQVYNGGSVYSSGEQEGDDVESGMDDGEQEARATTRVRAAQLLYAYKQQATAVLRDVSLMQRNMPPHFHALVQIEQFVRQEWSRRAARPMLMSTAARLGRRAHDKDGESDEPGDPSFSLEDEEETKQLASVLQELIRQLLLPGALFPTDMKQRRGRRGRTDVAGMDSPVSEETAQLWDPLFRHMHVVAPMFLPLLVDALVCAAMSERTCARAWLQHLANMDEIEVPLHVPRWPHENSGSHDMTSTLRTSTDRMRRGPLRRTVIFYALETPDHDLHTLALSLCDNDANLHSRVEQLCRLHQLSHVDESVAASACLGEMEERAATLPFWSAENDAAYSPTGDAMEDEAMSEPHHARLTGQGGTSFSDGYADGDAAASPVAADSAPPGWRRAPASYTATPIGCLAGQRPALLLWS